MLEHIQKPTICPLYLKLIPAGDECSAEEAVALVTSPTLSTVSQPSSSSSASGAISDDGDLLKTVATSKEL